MGKLWVGWTGLVTSLLLTACGPKHEGTTGVGGGPGSGGGGQGPSLPGGVSVDAIRQVAIDKMDLLFVVDNSISMSDKQALLAEALPLLVQRLVTPMCVRECTPSDDCTEAQQREGIPVGGNTINGFCINGAPEMPPLTDIHVGVITSSLGSHGASGAKDVCVSVEDDDHAHLLGQLRPGLETWSSSGFLAWDPNARKNPAGDSDPSVFVQKVTAMVEQAGEHGCGYESTLESWYRFLIDPEPPAAIVQTAGMSTVQGVDMVLLDQRSKFLRPDSVLAIVMLTDENDCSIVDEGLGFTVATSTPISRSTSACGANPNDPCCQACSDAAAKAGCPALASDAECQKGPMLSGFSEDDLNLRCWEQKRRFGIDLLYPISRYVDGLQLPSVTARSSGMLVPNPLYIGNGGAPRDRGMVLLAGIVGVPWQDLADDESLTGPGLRFLTSSELTAQSRWDVMLGNPQASPPLPPLDPLMVETPDDRTALALPQVHPITGDALVPGTSMDPRANPINGHEHVNMGNRDLQYACTFELPTPRTCDQAAFDSDAGCDCFQEDLAFNRPLCQPPGGGAASITQYYAKAYPGLRLLQTLKEFGDNSIIGSTCPKVLDNGSPDYGYNPVAGAIIRQVREVFRPRCFPRPLPLVEQDSSVACVVVEALPGLTSCDCNALGLKPLTGRASISAAVQQVLEQSQTCGDSSGVPCDSFCQCELPQLTGGALASCQGDPEPPQTTGFCYINATPDEPQVGNPDLVAGCALDSRRLLRFTGAAPSPGASTFVVCEP